MLAALGGGAAGAADDHPWEGALGMIVSNSPEYQGAADRVTKFVPGFFLRYGRVTVTNASGFVTRRSDDVERGVGLDLSPSDRFKLKLALRFDGGRDEGDSPALAGLGDIKPTVRARLNGVWQADPHWKLGASWSVDILGRGGGNLGELSAQHESHPTPDTTLSLATIVTLAGERYLQTYFGVSPVQAAHSGYPEYSPGFGVRDASLAASLNTEVDRHWVALGGLSVTRLLGPAADSPLVKKPNSLRITAGLAYRF
jgi:outer membrane scaffolding protein for murein synthesis (MipA/OmpV family)